MAALVHHGVMTGFAAIPSDCVVPLQVCMGENDFCWLSCLFANQCKIQTWCLTTEVSGCSAVGLGVFGLGYVCLFGEWMLHWSNTHFCFNKYSILLGSGIASAL